MLVTVTQLRHTYFYKIHKYAWKVALCTTIKHLVQISNKTIQTSLKTSLIVFIIANNNNNNNIIIINVYSKKKRHYMWDIYKNCQYTPPNDNDHHLILCSEVSSIMMKYHLMHKMLTCVVCIGFINTIIIVVVIIMICLSLLVCLDQVCINL